MSTDTAVLRLQVEKLGVSAPGCRIRCFYTAPGNTILVPVDGRLDDIKRGAPGQPVIVTVDGLRHAIPAGTWVTVEAKELR